MKILKKHLLLMMLLGLTFPVCMRGDIVETIVYAEEVDEEIGTFSEDHIKYYYRVVDGVLQYRRWNVTRGYWIDATWLNVPEV